jgi:hypothetical protein
LADAVPFIKRKGFLIFFESPRFDEKDRLIAIDQFSGNGNSSGSGPDNTYIDAQLCPVMGTMFKVYQHGRLDFVSAASIFQGAG